VRWLTHVLLLTLGFGALHLLMLRRRPRPLAAFALAGGCWHVVVGLAVHGRMLAAQGARALTALAWLPAFLLAFFTTGAVLALAWVGGIAALRLGAGRLHRGRRGPTAP
jgi:hypothetical protein